MTPDQHLRPTRRQLENLGFRAGWTFVQSFTGVLAGAAVFDWDVSTIEMAAAAGIGAVLSVAKNFASVRLGTQE